jgi:hypothetical protein
MRLPLRGGSSRLAALRQHVRDGSVADIGLGTKQTLRRMSASGQKRTIANCKSPAPQSCREATSSRLVVVVDLARQLQVQSMVEAWRHVFYIDSALPLMLIQNRPPMPVLYRQDPVVVSGL